MSNPFATLNPTAAVVPIEPAVTYDVALALTKVEYEELDFGEKIIAWVKGPAANVKPTKPAGQDPYRYSQRSALEGIIACHTYGKPVVRGKNVLVEIRVWKKMMHNGRVYTFLNFHETDAEEATHRFFTPNLEAHIPKNLSDKAKFHRWEEDNTVLIICDPIVKRN